MNMMSQPIVPLPTGDMYESPEWIFVLLTTTDSGSKVVEEDGNGRGCLSHERTLGWLE